MIKRFGVLASDPELYYTYAGLPVCRLTVRGTTTDYVRLVAFGELAEEIAQEASKEDAISVIGYFKERSWETKDGERKSEQEFIVKQWELRR